MICSAIRVARPLSALCNETFASVRLRIVPSDQPTPDMLREERCDLVISPFPPEGVDILKKRLSRRRICMFLRRDARAPRTGRRIISPPTT